MSLFAEPVLGILSSATLSLRACPWPGQDGLGMPLLGPQASASLIFLLSPYPGSQNNRWEKGCSPFHEFILGTGSLKAFKHSTQMYVNLYTYAEMI